MKDYSRFLKELTSGVFFVRDGALNKYDLYLMAMAQGMVPVYPDLPEIKMSLFDGMGSALPTDKNEDVEQSIAVIPMHGVLTRYGSWWDYGTEDLAQLYAQAFADPSISAVITDMDCDGGSFDAYFPLKSVLSQKNKPLYCAVKGGCYSLGYLAACMHDKILTTNEMVQVGSIGVMAKVRDLDGMYTKMGATVKEVYPPESDWKNKPIRDLKEGNSQTLIDEQLTPLAKFFQDAVKTARPKLNANMEGVLTGRTFFANYGENTALAAGLIDDIQSFEDIIRYAFNATQAPKLKSLF